MNEIQLNQSKTNTYGGSVVISLMKIFSCYVYTMYLWSNYVNCKAGWCNSIIWPHSKKGLFV